VFCGDLCRVSPLICEVSLCLNSIENRKDFSSRRKKLKLEEQRARAQEAVSTLVGERNSQRRTLRDFVTSGV